VIYRALWCSSFRSTGGQVETIGQKQKRKDVLNLALNNVRESQFRTDVNRDFQTDGTAMLKERLPKNVRLKGTCSSGADDDCSDRILLRHDLAAQILQY